MVLLAGHQRVQYLFELGLVVFHSGKVSQISLERLNPLLFFSILLRLLLTLLFQAVDMLVSTSDLCSIQQQHNMKIQTISVRFCSYVVEEVT